jgi:hypothetical protein
MVKDLIDSQQLLGKRRAQVLQLLGPVTETDKFRDWDMVYVLGPQSGYIDNVWLVLRTDGGGTVVEQKVVYD